MNPHTLTEQKQNNIQSISRNSPDLTNQNLYQELLKLKDDCRNVKQAHFLAKQSKEFWDGCFSLLIILFNACIFSPLFDYLFPEYSQDIVKTLAILSASIAGIQKYFSYQKKNEIHSEAGTEYAEIYRLIKIALAKHKNNLDGEEFREKFDGLHNIYLAANKKYSSCLPTNK